MCDAKKEVMQGWVPGRLGREKKLVWTNGGGWGERRPPQSVDSPVPKTANFMLSGGGGTG